MIDVAFQDAAPERLAMDSLVFLGIQRLDVDSDTRSISQLVERHPSLQSHLFHKPGTSRRS